MIVLYHTELQIMRLTDGEHAHSLGLGAAGPDLFFTIGGFILVYAGYNRKYTFGAFLYRRIIRIAPLCWLLTFLMLVVLLVAPSHLLTTKFESWHFFSRSRSFRIPIRFLGSISRFWFRVGCSTSLYSSICCSARYCSCRPGGVSLLWCDGCAGFRAGNDCCLAIP